MSQPRTIPQSKDALLKSYTKRFKDDIKSMLDNFTEIIKLARIEEDSQLSKPAQSEQDQFEMQVRAANIVRAGESLMKLVSDIKQFLIINDFPSANESISQKTILFKNVQTEMDNKLIALRDEMALELYDLEEEYYSSSCK